ncbi:helix-turn-helix transcriptional regulator [Salininema proteolyticum]|uniref:Helix-turn-helix transcriptional regulator n=1 Tax=Salininema proteolyticum TaxID=1607685 RepID=A0ABV8TZM6_9ACTN
MTRLYTPTAFPGRRRECSLFTLAGEVSDQDTFSHNTIRLGTASITEIRLRHTEAAASNRPAPGSESELVDFWVVRSGRMSLSQAGNTAILHSGEIVSAVRRDSYELFAMDNASITLFSIPYSSIGIEPCGVGSLVARSWQEGGRPDRFRAQVVSFAESVATLCESASVQYGYHCVELMAVLLQSDFAHCKEYQMKVRAQTLQRMKAWAQDRLDDPNLSIGQLATAHNVSARYVQKLFKEQGQSPSKWIRDRRLARCLADLQNERKRHQTIARIAREWGFWNPSYFTRIFREHYGITPAALRAGEAVAVPGTRDLAGAVAP